MMINSPVCSPLPVTALPDELIAEVLLLFTIKSLVRLKCVSKSWNRLISDPLFVKMHGDKSSQNTDFTLISANYTGSSTYMKLTVFPEHSLLANEATTMVTNHDTIYKIFFNEYHQIIGSCNGLCCLMQLSSNAEYKEFSFRLCNPATRSLSHKLASFRISLNHPDSLLKFSFGYDNLTRSYKVVAFRLTEVRLFTLGVNLWKNIQSFPIIPLNFTCVDQNGGLYLNNCLIWYGHCANLFNPLEQFVIEQFVIIALDLGTERCTEMMPPQGFDGEVLFMTNIWVMMDCLCFSHHSNENNFVIWQMREFGVEESWIKLLNINFQGILRKTFSYSRYDRMLLLHVLENGNTLILANGEGQVIRYNRRDNRVDPITISDTRSLFFAHRYVESLASVC